MSSIDDKILLLAKQLYPTGRAFKMPEAGVLELFHRAIGSIQADAYLDATSILFSILPDNASFTEDDAEDWERRLGMITNPLVLLEDRKLAIIRKLNAPGINPAKSNYLYLQDQLQKAGFNVYVHENIFPDYPTGYVTQTAYDVAAAVSIPSANGILTEIQHGDIQHGDAQHGYRYNNIIANHIDEARDVLFNIGSTWRATFFIGGSTVGSFATVDENRKDEFRQLILRVKPVHNIGFLFINYTA